mgnify:FL=1
MAEQDFAMAKVSTGAERGLARYPSSSGAMVNIEQARAIQEATAKLIIAKQCPRSQEDAAVKISIACKRPGFASKAFYKYTRGQEIEGPNIRMAEMLAQSWGNLECGLRELRRGDGESEMESFAWDLETNVRINRIFTVKHERYSKAAGNVVLTDQRDIYEALANYGSRRLRACILAVIPKDVVDDAIAACKSTLLLKGKAEGPIEDRIKKMALAFHGLGVTVEMMEDKLGHKMAQTTEEELVDMLGVYNGIKDGDAKREDYFHVGGAAAETKKPEPKKEEEQKKTAPTQEEKKAKQAEEVKTTSSATTNDQIKQSLEKNPFACPKDGTPLATVVCDGCEIIASCQAMSGTGAPSAAAQEEKTKPKEKKAAAAGGKFPDKFTCENQEQKDLVGKTVLLNYCQKHCAKRENCETIKFYGGPAK